MAGLVIAIVQVTGTCLMSISNHLGPSPHHPEYLREITSDLYSFHATIRNLQMHLDVYEADQARLNALSLLQRPLEMSRDSLQIIKSRLEDATFFGEGSPGSGFDRKLKDCVKCLKIGRTLFHDVLHMDGRLVLLSSDADIWRC